MIAPGTGCFFSQVEALVSENANCTMLNVSGHTPLDLACQGGHAQVTQLVCVSGFSLHTFLLSQTFPVGGEPVASIWTVLPLLPAALRHASHSPAPSC